MDGAEEDDVSTNVPDRRFLIADFVPHMQRQRSVSTPELDISLNRRRTISSYVALRDALLTLYRLDDFIQEPLGNGFFSDVFKVEYNYMVYLCSITLMLCLGFHCCYDIL